jgi:membrane dipeptidase
LAEGPTSTEPDLSSLRPDVAALLASADVWDMIMPAVTPNLPMWINALACYRRTGWTFVSLTLQDWPPTFEGMRRKVARFRELVQPHENWLTLYDTYSDIDTARAEGKLLVGIHSQETRVIEHDLSRVEVLHGLGVRHMLLAYNVRNLVADGCAEPADAGLSNFGRALVREMDRVGIIVDGSHTGRRSSLEAIELTERPFVFSHTGARAVYDHIRCVDDEQIRACAATGGVIGILGLGAFLGDPDASVETVFRHVDHIASIVGVEHVGIGTDYVPYMPASEHPAEWTLIPNDRFPDPSIAWPDGDVPDWGYFRPGELPALVEMMLDHGYSNDDVRAILGANFKRVYASLDAADSEPVVTPPAAGRSN